MKNVFFHSVEDFYPAEAVCGMLAREESQTVSINSGVEIVYSINLVLDLPCVCVLEERNLTSLVRLGLNFQRPYKRIIIHDVSTSLV